jgi:hypothetical protein
MKESSGRPSPAPHAPCPRPGGAEEIPCRSRNRAPWKYAMLAAIFLAWLAFLIYCAVV